MMIPYAPPEWLLSHLANGSARIIGAMIHSTETGVILGHMQQTAGLLSMFARITGGAASGGFHPIEVAVSDAAQFGALVQNEQIKGKLDALQQSLALTQSRQYASLAVSGLGLGVSLAGFAIMSKRLTAIEKQLSVVGQERGAITQDQRDDELRDIFAEIEADLQQVDLLGMMEAQARAPTALQMSLARNAHKLHRRFLSGS